MAANKREEWEIERDREEISSLLARYRRMPHQRIADVLNKRRKDEYRNAVTEATADLREGDPIPAVPPPYELTRQMVTYEVKNLKREWRKFALEKFEAARAQQLATIDELERVAWEGYERSTRVATSLHERTVDVTVAAKDRDPDGTGLVREIKIPATKKTRDKTQEQLIGNPRFLEVIDRQIQRRNELLGLVTEEVNVNVQPTDVKLVAGFDPKAWDAAGEQEPPATAPPSTDAGTTETTT